MTKTLVDAGPLIALINAADPDHSRCVDALKRLTGPMVTTWMPVTEAMHLLGPSLAAQSALLRMIERGALEVQGVETEELPEIRRLMRKYADLPMDFADASLVQLARRDNLRIVFTLDRRDFAIYRLGRTEGFDIVP